MPREISLGRDEAEKLVDLLEACDCEPADGWRLDLASEIRERFGMATYAREMESKGYKVIVASECEVGLLHSNQGVRTWFKSDFEAMPGLDHPKIRKAIYITEQMKGANG